MLVSLRYLDVILIHELIDHIVSVNRAWLYNDLKVLQANGELSQTGECMAGMAGALGSIPTEGDGFCFLHTDCIWI